MPPQLGIFVLEEAIKDAPQIYATIQAFFTSSTIPSPDDWAKLRAAVSGDAYVDPTITAQAQAAPAAAPVAPAADAPTPVYAGSVSDHLATLAST